MPRTPTPRRRVLDAAHTLLQANRFEDMTLRELVDEAGVSSSSLYAHFPTKDALLAALYDEVSTIALAEVHAVAATAARGEPNWRELIAQFVRFYMAHHRAHGAVHRAMARESARSPAFAKARARVDDAVHAQARAFLLAHGIARSAPDPARRVDVALQTCAAMCRAIVASTGPTAPCLRMEEDELVESLAKLILGGFGGEP